jgi:phosphatidylglycerophosphate synthase
VLDGVVRRLAAPALDRMGAALARRSVPADAVTLAGFGVGLAAAAAIALRRYELGLALILLNRLGDGIDGAIARRSGTTDRGGFLDIVLDFTFYGAVPLGFVLADPTANAVPGAVLLFAFYANGASFLAFAVMAARRGLATGARGEKSLYFTTGLAEATETILVFALACLFPAVFPALAYAFAAVTLLTAGMRVAAAVRRFG